MWMELVGWLMIGFGLFTLTEGYHAFRQWTERSRPLQYWWLAGLIAAAGIGLFSAGLRITGV
ncbi:MAG: hypothetical protein ACJ0SL_03450 [Candidatus Rariloculaceae bacterium]